MADRAARSTYRVQLSSGFNFADLAGLSGYLSELGVSHVYCSPVLQAAAGSTHGYDVVDPGHLSSELGGAGGYSLLVERLHHHHLGQLVDIVPNHMALASRANAWWWDVLANGPSSPYARYFDIDWDSQRKLTGTVLVPILADHYGRVLEAGDIRVGRDGGWFVVRYREHTLPLSPRSASDLVAQAAARALSDELQTIAAGLAALPHALIDEREVGIIRAAATAKLAADLDRLAAASPEVAAAVEVELDAINEDADLLDALLERQNYRLAFWRTASDDLDYRRFFNIETLAGVRVEDEEVFDATHKLMLSLVSAGTVDGLRVDHVDGLRDPEGYLARLCEATDGAWVVVEKVLASGERVPEHWPVAGTTGYEFLNCVNGLFVAGENGEELTRCYEEFVAAEVDYPALVHDCKIEIMRDTLAAEVERLTTLWALVCERHRRHRDYTRRELRQGLREVLACFPVYRTYVRPGSPLGRADRDVIDRALAEANRRCPELDPQLFEFLGRLLRLEHRGEREEELAARFQQLSSPVMAKGVEDTAFYRYNRLVSMNEVGGRPDVLGGAVDRFHALCQETAERFPTGLVTLATHDTKRGSDTRARINVLSEIPRPWRDAVGRWRAHNDGYRSDEMPDRNDEYLLYQTLVGAWPVSVERVGAYMEKATREARSHTSWASPNAAYDDAVAGFVTAVMGDAWFVANLERFLAGERVVEAGRVNSLAQVALLLTAPGCADLYQGTELWDHSLVDPDNRRPVDFATRRRLLAALGDDPPPVDGSGATKMWLTHKLLDDRRSRPDAYGPASDFRPLPATGSRAEHVVAFSRSGGLVCVVPRLSLGTSLAQEWGATAVFVPGGRWIDVLTGGAVEGGRHRPVSSLLENFAVAVLRPA